MSMAEQDAKSRYIVPALAHGLAVLGLFTRDRPTWTPPEIAQELALARATVFRLLQTLEASGYVVRDSGGRAFRLGPSVLNRGFAYLASLDLVEVARPILKRLRDDTGLSSHMAVRDGRDVVYVARFPARTTIASSVNIGTRFPVHATILGRMLICDFTDAQLAELYPDEQLPRVTEQTPRTHAALAALLVGDRARGYATSQSFFEHGVNAIAAPVRDAQGMVVAAINLTAVDARVTVEDMNGLLKDEVLKASAEITRWIVSDRDDGGHADRSWKSGATTAAAD